MSVNKVTSVTTVTMYRRPRKGFVPPRRTCDEPETEVAQTVIPPKKKRDLSPLFGKILRGFEEDADTDSSQMVESGDDDRKETTEPTGSDKSEKEQLDEFSDLLEDLSDSWNGEEKVELENDVEMVSPRVSQEKLAITRQLSPFESFKKPRTPPVRSNFSVTLDDDEEIENFKSQSQSSQPLASQDSDDKKYYACVFGKLSTRKHKTFEDDGFITVTNGVSVTLKNASGKVIESSRNYPLSEEILDGQTFKLGGKEIQISEELQANPFATDVKPPPVSQSSTQTLGKLPQPKSSRPFVSPLTASTVLTEKPNKNLTKPMFNPDDSDALVMPVIDKAEDVLVVVDPHLCRHLRDHQREGIKFLYKCVMSKHYQGAILADEMGLGKTLQCITLLWTLLKQGPYQRKEIVKRGLIVCPSSLVTNWEKEFHRWLGHERIRVFAVNSDHPLKHCPPQCPIIIMSYEMATRSEDALKKMRFDIIVCDEAHKIKNKNGQAYSLLSKMQCRRRILLTGTPVQNDLMELYTLVNFCNPGVLGEDYEFRKDFEKPIEKYQEQHSTLVEKQIGQQKAVELNNLLNNFFLRRSHNVMIRYLPPRVTYVIICKPSQLQIDLYRKLLSSNVVQDCVSGSGNCSSPLSVILALKKLCNHPNLVHPKCNSADKAEESLYHSLGPVYPTGHRHDLTRTDQSGKMKVLENLLKRMKIQREKCVVVSHYTQTLDLLEDLCRSFNFPFKRLDGTTIAKQRQQIVDQFNQDPKEFVFLLSSKAGGVGLNLQGASNIVLYDIDWNPAHDMQAMSRCWRPGQKKLTNIYRLITSGTIEERIYHRQISKQDLSGSVMDLLLSNSSVKFSPEDLKDIFSLWDEDNCLTHELIDCNCGMEGQRKDLNSSVDDEDIENLLAPPTKKKKKGICTMAELNSWEHHGPPFESLEHDGILSAKEFVQFVFCSRSLPASQTQCS